ncbi:DUF6247 family protein [Nocardia sp. NPDC056100]|uniref:DUF6247 family protein n=1 Tax=Nocardia sp. NPDC056100 TaxID=3345712 RepID=UPI0035DC64CE
MVAPRDESTPQVPVAEAEAVRALLTPTLVAEFDREWDLVCEQVDLHAVTDLLNKWQHIAVMESRSPGSWFEVLAKAEQILRAGGRAETVTIEEHRAAIARRLHAD